MSGRNRMGAVQRRAAKAAVFERDGWACVMCGSGEQLTLDHIVPLSQGGGNKLSNLQTMCESCNSAKGDAKLRWRR